MSGSTGSSAAAALSTAAFSDLEKADIRRFCGYQTYGAGAANIQVWRFFQVYGLLEFRMTNLAAAELQNVRLYLSYCYAREQDIQAAYANLDTERAAVWTHNKNELTDREALFRRTRLRLCQCLGVEPGPALPCGGNQARIVV